jgi:hypothetical protein
VAHLSSTLPHQRLWRHQGYYSNPCPLLPQLLLKLWAATASPAAGYLLLAALFLSRMRLKDFAGCKGSSNTRPIRVFEAECAS